MENQDHIVSDAVLVKHFAYIGVVMVAVALGIGLVANSIAL